MASRILAGRYDLKEKIGEGGMSVVFRAQDIVLSRYVAVKILRPEYTKDEQFIESFRRESQLAASIVDPNIVNVYDVGREGNIYYIVMELVEGKTLSEIIKDQGALDPKRAVSIARQIAMALATAHKHNLIHRDVKPHNVLISKDDVAKIADFGIAKEVTNDTIVGEQKEAVMGSIHYFSPEQARGTGVDERSDIYSLGIVLYEMVTGQVPFDGETAVEVAVKHISEAMTPPSRLNPNIPQDVEDIIMKATAKIPEDRYSSADEMITDLSFVKYSKGSDYLQDLEDRKNSGEEIGVDVDEEKIKETNDKFAKFNIDSAEKKKKLKEIKRQYRIPKILAVVLGIIVAFLLSAVVYKLFFDPAKKVSKEIKLPKFVDMTLEEATNLAMDNNITIEVELEINSSEYAAGIIMSQSPSADAAVKTGSIVKVTVSKGANDGTIPNVIGKAQTSKRPNAQKLIESYGYVLGKISYEHSSSIPEGYVISQNPEKGTSAPAGTKINLVLSSGPKEEDSSGETGDNPGTDITVDGDKVIINIPNGTSGKKIGEILVEAGLAESSSAFVDRATEMSLINKLRSGEYTISKDASLDDIIKQIAHSK